MTHRRRPDPQALAQARRLLRTHGRMLRADERRLLESLLDRIERGTIGRKEVLSQLAGPLRARGLSPEQAMRRLRATPYYALLERILPER